VEPRGTDAPASPSTYMASFVLLCNVHQHLQCVNSTQFETNPAPIPTSLDAVLSPAEYQSIVQFARVSCCAVVCLHCVVHSLCLPPPLSSFFRLARPIVIRSEQEGRCDRTFKFGRGGGQWVINGETWRTARVAAKDIGLNSHEVWCLETSGRACLVIARFILCRTGPRARGESSS
jgi:hypothetical protein